MDEVEQTEKEFHQKQHHERYRLVLWKLQDTCSLCGDCYSQCTHTELTENQVCDDCMVEGLGNKHTQIFLGSCNQVFDDTGALKELNFQ